MKNKSPKKARSRAEILAEIAALPPSVQGTISSYKNVRRNGTAAVYYNLQYTHKGKNHSFAIPTGKVADFKAAVAAGRKLKDLVLELSLANARELASSESTLKKARAPRPEGRRGSTTSSTRPRAPSSATASPARRSSSRRSSTT